MSSEFEIIQGAEDFEVTVRIVRRVREYVGRSNYRGEMQEASVPAVREEEIESIQFMSSTKDSAVRRAVGHLNLIVGAE